MAKISKEEYWVLNESYDSWRWLARDKNTSLWVYEKEPRKHEDLWDEFSGVCEVVVESDLFQFIQWEDEEPYNIQELLEEYEKELEEAEVKKDKKWLIGKLTKERNETNVHDPAYQYLSEFIKEVNQLEEPEVLSSDWIKDNQLMWTSIHGSEYYVPSNKLYGKLVPKQEETNDDLYILKVGGGYMTDFELTVGRVTSFSRESEYGADVVRASKPFMEFIQKQVGGELHNITNPEEQKYIVKLPLPGNETNDFAVVDIYGDIWLDGEWPSHYKMTEKEIKALPKGEVYFEHFAVKVEEME